MDLVRLGNAHFEKPEDSVYQIKQEMRVAVLFKNFGLGDERTSDFRVNFTWSDIEKLIFTFAIMGDPSAIRLQQAENLGKAVSNAGWLPQSN